MVENPTNIIEQLSTAHQDDITFPPHAASATNYFQYMKRQRLVSEVIFRIRHLRNVAKCYPDERILVWYCASGELGRAIEEFEDTIAAEVLASTLLITGYPEGDQVLEDKVNGQLLILAITKI
jgi:hypothetical protein